MCIEELCHRMPSEDSLAARDATHKEDKGERANKLEIYYEYRLVDSGRKEKVEVGISPKKINEDKIRQHEPN